MSTENLKQRLRREGILLVIMLLIGVVLMPIAAFLVGEAVFGEYAGQGFGHFFGELQAGLRSGEPVVVFLMLSPYLIWQLVRLTFTVFSRLSPRRNSPSTR